MNIKIKSLILLSIIALVPINALADNIDLTNELIVSNLQFVEDDLLFIKKLPVLDNLLNEDGNSLKNLQQTFLDLFNHRDLYSQIRYIDETGQEVLRVQNTNGNAEIIADSKLQNKKDRYYFIETMVLNDNEIYVSPMDLNVENGILENRGTKENPLYVPTMRYSTPVFDEDGNRKGIMILNVYANKLIKNIHEGLPEVKYLVNSDGYFLHHKDLSKEYGFMLGREITVISEFGKEFEQIFLSDAGSIVSDGKKFDYKRIFPSKSNKDYFWILIEEEEYVSNNIFEGLIVFSILLLVAIFFLVKFNLLRSEKTIIVMIVFFLIFVILFSIINTYQNTKTIRENHKIFIDNTLSALASSQGRSIENYLDSILNRAEDFASDGKISQMIMDHNFSDADHAKIMDELNNHLIKNKLVVDESIIELYVMDNEGHIVGNSNSKEFHSNSFSEDEIFIEGIKGPYFSDPYYEYEFNKYAIKISYPIIREGKTLGVIYLKYNAMGLYDITLDKRALGESGEVYLLNKEKIMISPSRFLENAIFNQIVDTQIFKSLQNDESILEPYPDYRSIDVVGHIDKIKGTDWNIVAEFDFSESFGTIDSELRNIWISTFGMVIVFLVMGIVFNILVTRVLRKEIESKTKELKDFNIKLESTVAERTEELDKKSSQLENYNVHLMDKVRKATKELEKKLEKEAKSTKAMIYLLERSKRINKELDENKNLLETEKKSVEKKVMIRTIELVKEKKKVEKLLLLKTEFVNQLSHDLRTPLVPILSLLPIALKNIKDKIVKKDIEVALRNAKYLQLLVTDTLNLARIDSGTIEFRKSKINISKIVKEIIHDNKIVFIKNNIKVKNKIKENLYACGDNLRIKEVLQNLQTNAIKFMPEGGRLTFNVKKSGDQLCVFVKDTGIGIKQNDLDKIFNEFHKADESRHDMGNVGLGLTICKKIIEKHGGKIWAESKGLGKGTTFHFTLPLYKKM